MTLATPQVPADTATVPPGRARELFRVGLKAPTSGWCEGYAQANLIAVPRDLAYDMLLFGQRNPRPCPVLDVTEPGDPRPLGIAPEADLRTDLPAYRVWKDGELAGEVTDVTRYWREDMVAFLLGCSFTFEHALLRAGVPVRHLEQGRNVPMYRTSLACRPAGRLGGPLVVSMRPIPRHLVPLAAEVTARYPRMHGAPVHHGDPREIGISSLDQPDYGDPVEMEAGDVPVFWACGVTPQAAVTASRPPFAISHAPGHMFITDKTHGSFTA
ncbi:MAG TPA: putative hydro-lyase [Streptosporangiaceae bacterium]|nr:putative hydro-lyase [Streptosporangiaceae bacterium]